MCLAHTLTTLLGKSIAYFIPELATEIIAICLFWILGIYAIFTSCRVYRKKYLRKKAGLPETTEESEVEIIELEE
jgi:putative Mn2+ efflux pump MntP